MMHGLIEDVIRNVPGKLPLNSSNVLRLENIRDIIRRNLFGTGRPFRNDAIYEQRREWKDPVNKVANAEFRCPTKSRPVSPFTSSF